MIIGDGCDFFPDGNWKHCCDVHDDAFAVVGNIPEWWQATIDLGQCVGAINAIAGALIFLGVACLSWAVYKFATLNGRTIFSIVTGKEYGPGLLSGNAEASMPVSSTIVNYIGAKEGKVLKAYRDPVHIITIGYGATWASKSFRAWYAANRGPGKLKMGDTMSEREALDVLKLMLAEEYAPPVDAAFAAQKQHTRDAGTSMVYNCGPGSLKWKWAQAIMRGALAEGCRLWRTTATTAKGKKLPGLAIRRREEADIGETGRYPAWFTSGIAPQRHIDAADIRQAQVWLTKLGYEPGPADGVPGQRTVAAARRFQTEHGQLTVDGIIGAATLAALQRAIDARGKAGGVAGAGIGTGASGGLEQTTGAADVVDAGWLGDVLLWGGVAILVVGLVWVSWRYRDEIGNIMRKL